MPGLQQPGFDPRAMAAVAALRDNDVVWRTKSGQPVDDVAAILIEELRQMDGRTLLDTELSGSFHAFGLTRIPLIGVGRIMVDFIRDRVSAANALETYADLATALGTNIVTLRPIVTGPHGAERSWLDVATLLRSALLKP